MDWNDPAARYHLIEQVGTEEYNRRFRAHQDTLIVSTANGYKIRRVHSQRFGELFMIDPKGVAYATQGDAEREARKLEKGPN